MTSIDVQQFFQIWERDVPPARNASSLVTIPTVEKKKKKCAKQFKIHTVSKNKMGHQGLPKISGHISHCCFSLDSQYFPW